MKTEKDGRAEIKMRLKRGALLLRQDLYDLRIAILGIGIYTVAAQLLFGQFCPMMLAFRVPCPGCGMTRAFALTVTGRFLEAWELQPLVYGWILLGLWFVLNRYFLGKGSRWMQIYLILLLLGTLALYLCRLVWGFPEALFSEILLERILLRFGRGFSR